MSYQGRCPVMRALAATLVLLSAPLAWAQGAAGVLAGKVTDAFTGLGVPDVEVALSGPAAATTHTASNGGWRLVALPDGHYQIRIRRAGYAGRTVEADATVYPGAPALTIALEPVPVSLDAIVVTAARREQKLKDAVAAIELVTRSEIEASGAQDVGTVLTEQTGIQLDGGTPAGTGAYLQGMGDQRVLVLLDGQPLTGRINGNFDLSRFSTAPIDHVEVVKGPQSTLYGSDAMGGVINIITRGAGSGPFAMNLSTVAGTQGMFTLNGGLRGASGAFGYSADLGLQQTSLASGVAGSSGTQTERYDADAAARWSPDSAFALTASVLGVVEKQRYLTGQLYNFGDNQQWAGRVGAAFTGSTVRVSPLLYLSSFDHLSRASTQPQPASDSGANDVQQLVRLEVPVTARFGTTTLDAGLDLQHTSEEAARIPGGRRTINSAEPYAQGTFTLGDWSLVPGFRASYSEQWGTAITPRIAAMWRPTPPLALRLSLGTGYRAPDFKELYIDFVNAAYGYAVVGNPKLQPEHSVGAMADLEWAGTRYYGRANVYYNRFRDFIEYVGPDALGVYTYANVAQGTTNGVELEGGVTAGPLKLDAGYAYLRTHDDVTGGALLGRPAHSARITAGVGINSWLSANATGLYTGATPTQEDPTGQVTATRPAYTRFDLRATARLPLSLQLVAGVNNVLDKQLGALWPGYTGRAVYAGVSWSTQ